LSGPSFRQVTVLMSPQGWTGHQLALTRDPAGQLPDFFQIMEPVDIPVAPDPLTFGAWSGASTPDHAALRSAM
jgi:hypothetical protein